MHKYPFLCIEYPLFSDPQPIPWGFGVSLNHPLTTFKKTVCQKKTGGYSKTRCDFATKLKNERKAGQKWRKPANIVENEALFENLIALYLIITSNYD